MRNKFNLESRIFNELVKLKEDCWINGSVNLERLERYREKIKQLKNEGYNVGVHECIVEQLYGRLEKATL